MQVFSLAIIEDQPSIREVLSEYLGHQPEFRCEVIVDSIEALLAQLEASPGLSPDLVLCDIGLPGLTGIEGLPFIRARLPEAQVLMLSVFTDAEQVYQALQAGAVGYLVKNTPLVQLKEHLLQVAAGGSPMSPAVARHVVQAFQRLAKAPAAIQTTQEPLTSRELEIVQCIEDGLSYKLIATRLFISVDTVRNHIRAVYRKLQINSKGQLMARAIRRQS